MQEIHLLKINDWSTLYNKWKNYVLSCCEWDEDIAQEVWIKVLIKKDKFTYGSFKSWVSTICINTKIDLERQKWRRRESFWENYMDNNFLANEFCDEIDMFPSVKIAKEELEYQLIMIDEALNRLHPKEKDVVILRKYKSFKEIADIMDTSVDSALQNMNRARKHIKLILKNLSA